MPPLLLRGMFVSYHGSLTKKLTNSVAQSQSDLLAGGMGSNPSGGTARERNKKAETDMNGAGWVLTGLIVVIISWIFISNSECKWKGQIKEFRGMQESIPKVDQ